MMKTEFKAIDIDDDYLVFVDQTKLPLIEDYVKTDNYERIAEAIEKLEIRGAPAIGVAAAYALALSVKKSDDICTEFYQAKRRLASTRPTAVNLFWALEEMSRFFDTIKEENDVYRKMISRAKDIHKDDFEKCEAIAANGLQIFSKRSVVLTHCNTGSLATGGRGTAFNVIRAGYEKGLVEFVYADETRPLFQGSRLTAFELEKAGIPFMVNTDSTAAFLMKNKKIDLVITGADRIAANGDTANKIGTYNLAVLCSFHKIPFYIAAPETTIDRYCADGESIKIELRDKKELFTFKDVQVTSENYDVYAPAFDVTPAGLISGIITEKDFYKFPFIF
ncbi:MAG: S-methyl-5-thioribose-1-phosphate isomerase [Ignavibacteriales bacterium]